MRKSLDCCAPPALHRHDFYELFLVERGRTEHFVNGTVQPLRKGALVFIRPDDTHAFVADRETGCRIINIGFRVDSANHLLHRYQNELANRYFWSAAPIPSCYMLSGPRMERAVNSAVELKTSVRSLARIEQFLLAIMIRVVGGDAVSDNQIPDWLRSACTNARTPAGFRGGVRAFVRVAGRGHAHVCRAMQRHLGMSPTDFLNRVRMEYAAMRLKADPTAISEIAHDCGFENVGHFYRLFREHYGSTPRTYRLRHRLAPNTTIGTDLTARPHDPTSSTGIDSLLDHGNLE